MSRLAETVATFVSIKVKAHEHARANKPRKARFLPGKVVKSFEEECLTRRAHQHE